MSIEQTALITGATSGFGWEFCRLFAKNGHNLVMVARSIENLKSFGDKLKAEFPKIKVNHVAMDLASDRAAYELHRQVAEMGLEINYLINDAGIGEHGSFAENDMDKEMAMIHLNVIATTQLTKLYLREMLKRNEGRILQLSSVLGMIPTPKMAVYSATKAYMHFLTASIQEEIKDTEVTMTALYPGASDTGFFERAHAEDTVVYNDTPLYDAIEVAEAGYEGMMKGTDRVIPGALNKVQAYSSKILPDALLRKGIALLMENK